MVAADLSASAMPLLVGAMSHTSQCTNSPVGIIVLGTSGSSMISARLFADAGTPVKSKGGFTLSASHEYFAGMSSPFLNAGLEIFNVPDGVCAAATRPQSANAVMTAAMVFIGLIIAARVHEKRTTKATPCVICSLLS